MTKGTRPTDEQVLNAVVRIRAIIDGFRTDPVANSKRYFKMYDELQSTYASALTAARRRRLPIEPWEGDELVFSPLVDRWVKIHDYL